MKPFFSVASNYRAGLLLFSLLLISISGASAVSANARPMNILFVFSWHKEMPWQKEVEKGFQQHFGVEGARPNLYSEYLDAGRFRSQQQINIFRNYLARKYASVPLDHVIFESESAAALFERSPTLFKNATTMLLNPGPRYVRLNESSTVVPVNVDFESSIKEILPFIGNGTIYLVGGTTPGTRDRVKKVSEILARIVPHRKVVHLVGLRMRALLDRVNQLDPEGTIFYLLILSDAEGQRFIPYEAARQVSQRSNVPVYSFWTSLMGSGVTGGYMLSGELVGREAAAVLMNGDSSTGSNVTGLNKRFHGLFFDWRELRRWKINLSALPRGSTVMFRQPGFYEEYYLELGIGISVLILVVLSIRFRELKKYNHEINSARESLEIANRELGRVQKSLEEKNELLQGLSVTDSLTGLYNRGYLDKKLADECLRAERYKEDLSIILADIDRFKEINDEYGHQAGDDVLVSVSDTLRRHLRNTDTIGRWGGEEFMIVCPNSDELQTLQLAKKLLEAVEESTYGVAGSVTCSFGVAGYEPGNNDVELIRFADQALYASKHSGRNRVTGASSLKSDR